MKLEIKDYCVRCGMCEDIYTDLFHLNVPEDRVEIKFDEIPPELEEKALGAIADCAVGAIFKK